MVRYPSERCGTRRILVQMRHFNSFIEDSGLVDLPLRGVDFT